MPQTQPATDPQKVPKPHILLIGARLQHRTFTHRVLTESGAHVQVSEQVPTVQPRHCNLIILLVDGYGEANEKLAHMLRCSFNIPTVVWCRCRLIEESIPRLRNGRPFVSQVRHGPNLPTDEEAVLQALVDACEQFEQVR